MKREDVLAALKEKKRELQERFGVKTLRLFGSTARDQASDESDVDLLVAFTQPPRFRDFMDLRFFLEDLLEARVDLVTETGLRNEARPYVEKDAIRVA